MPALRILKQSEIDREKWDGCIASAPNALPYAFSWYLDAVAENWDGLVYGNYETVMPLVWLRKLGIKCLYQPYYCQQLGVFGKEAGRSITALLEAAANKFSYININLNPSAMEADAKFKLQKRKNLLLDLDKSYEHLRKSFSENHKRSISKAQKAGYVFNEEKDAKAYKKFYLATVEREKLNFKKKHEAIFTGLTDALLKHKMANIYSVADAEGNTQAAVLLINYKGRLINIINASTPTGKKNGASHFLFDEIIKPHAAQQGVLDFEGSSVASIARFYEGFGAREETFFRFQKSWMGLKL